MHGSGGYRCLRSSTAVASSHRAAHYYKNDARTNAAWQFALYRELLIATYQALLQQTGTGNNPANIITVILPMDNTTIVHTNRFTLHAADGAPIAGTVRSTGGENKPVVLVFHGLRGFKDWGFFPYVCEHLARRGAVVVSINFSLNGVREGSDSFDDLDNFARNTISRELEEAGLVIETIASGSLASIAPLVPHSSNSLYLLGHSRGGGIALLATRDCQHHIARTAVWNSVSTYDRFTPRQKQEWRSRGVLEAMNTRTKQMMAMNVAYLDDIEINAERLAPLAAISDISRPVLIVHGEQDMTVPVREARKLAEAYEEAELAIIPQAGHTFNAVHPFAGTTPQLERAIAITETFFGLEHDSYV